ncbi:hypothetical protein BDB01DRAFT_100307 [Pilobolus umbonatus]|nr:hypothetical protein BDB01DRAFT_100307 [Pilobolus umbonatus]
MCGYAYSRHVLTHISTLLPLLSYITSTTLLHHFHYFITLLFHYFITLLFQGFCSSIPVYCISIAHCLYPAKKLPYGYCYSEEKGRNKTFLGQGLLSTGNPQFQSVTVYFHSSNNLSDFFLY